MDRQRVERALIGFLVGGLMGLVFNYIVLLLVNWISVRFGRQPFHNTWWDGLPLAIIMGLAMAINMANPPFGD